MCLCPHRNGIASEESEVEEPMIEITSVDDEIHCVILEFQGMKIVISKDSTRAHVKKNVLAVVSKGLDSCPSQPHWGRTDESNSRSDNGSAPE